VTPALVTDARARAAAVRRGAGLFRLEHRGVIAVSGGDARRWLDAMVTNDVAGLEAGGPGAHCHALLLTPIGRIAAELHVLARPDGFWLELERTAVENLIARLGKYVVADDVCLADASAGLARLGLEGPAAPGILAAAEPALAAAGVVTASYGWSGEPARQLFVPAVETEGVWSALAGSGEGRGLVEGDLATLEILRVESGTPRLGAELDEDVLPPEARLDDAVSTTKGCYTGQEVIARIRTRGQVKHLLVGLRFPDGEPPAPGDPIEVEGRRIGEVTSAALSPRAGAIALGFVARPHVAAGGRVRVAGRAAEVTALPFVEGAR
jgi:aminomethyltransferase